MIENKGTITYEAVPNFVQYSATDGTLVIYSKDQTDVGTYKLSVNATLASYDLFKDSNGKFSTASNVVPSDLIYQAGFFIEL